ncbi:MAG: hypothetical protein R3325_09105 [Thermoanaerobaculia bacterium]|nr:hypothetical protein [Thermoanaerobaculia bacterium]
MSNATPPGAAPAKKKGLPVLAWVAIGCGAILLLAVVGFGALGFFAVKKGKEMVQEATGADSFEEFVQELERDPVRTAAETAIRLNPELELVATDDDAGTITFRNTRTGEEATLDYDEIAQGRFSVSTEEGEYSIDSSDGVTITGPEGQTRFGAGETPSWVPLYPGVGEWETPFTTVTGDTVSGAVSGTTSDTPEAVVDHYRKWFEDRGYEVSNESMTRTPQGVFGGISGRLSDRERTVNVGVTTVGGELQVMVNYSGRVE